MAALLRDRLFQAWLLLCAVTLLSLVIGGSGGAAAGFAVLAIAFAKAWLVMFGFMEVARAPSTLKIIACVWLAGALGILLAVHGGVLG